MDYRRIRAFGFSSLFLHLCLNARSPCDRDFFFSLALRAQHKIGLVTLIHSQRFHFQDFIQFEAFLPWYLHTVAEMKIINYTLTNESLAVVLLRSVSHSWLAAMASRRARRLIQRVSWQDTLVEATHKPLQLARGGRNAGLKKSSFNLDHLNCHFYRTRI